MRRGKAPWQWLVRVLTHEGWQSTVVPGGMTETFVNLQDGAPQAVWVSAVSRLGREGQATRVKVGNRN